MNITDINALIEERNHILYELDEISKQQRDLCYDRAKIELSLKSLKADLTKQYQLLKEYDKQYSALMSEYQNKGNSILALIELVARKKKAVSSLNAVISTITSISKSLCKH